MIITYDEHYGRVELRHKSYTEEPYDKIDLDELVELWQNCKWIPCSEGLPSKGVPVLVNGIMEDAPPITISVDAPLYYEEGWINAWMPLPTPWKGADDE